MSENNRLLPEKRTHYQHKELAAGRWAKMPFVEQMANIGSEVERAINWRSRKNEEYALKAAERSLELFDLTLEAADTPSRIREVARSREAWAEHFYGDNPYQTTDEEWKKYFLEFAYAARKDR